jgi:two-component system, response regulator, stage 0 sporulation protein F
MKVKILYVDDEYINLELFKINFRTNYEVFIAENGFNGLEILKEHSDICIVISDMKMPNMDGVEFIQKAKKIYSTLKCFILTGFEITPRIKEALDSGLILKYFSKPFNINEIETTMKKHLN